MPKARSYKNEPWTSFEKQSFSVFKDDFVHEKVCTVKTTVESQRGGVNLKESLNQKGQTLTSTGQTKLWFYFRNNYSLYTKVLPNALTVSYDHGIQARDNKMFNWYGGVDTNRTLSNCAWRLGVDIFSATGDWMCNNMIQFNQNDRSLDWFHKAYTVRNQWILNNYATVSLTNKAIRQFAFLVGYKQGIEKSNHLFARFEVDGFKSAEELQNSLWKGNKVTLNWINAQKNNYVHGIEASSKLNELVENPVGLIRKLAAVFEVRIPQQSSVFKLRLGSDMSAALSLKHKMGSYGSYTWGAQLSDLGSKNNIKFGVQIDLNL